ncbi:glutamine-rich cytoplasmic protein [Tricharina praecox]|uniref:glutamine-rich cytoplasmic protein n=1 Tax=Tricharina praecox TaxID=43433 RepID=UPI00221E8E08|nr:glutamine-rich cytoplasmic protein [Tricharina praecox]KAI5855768.1 glutamine-rich cytoplasmic protein [Tricharina praecox]
MSTESKKKLALAVIDFLTTSTTDGTLSPDEKESIEVATQCIADAFKVDPEDKAAVADALGGQSLVAIYSVFEKMKGKTTPKPAASTTPAAGAGTKQPTDAEKAEAEALKSQGNAAMSKKDYTGAIDFYSQALNIHPNNPIYLSNRAAAFSNTGNYDAAIRDAETAVDTDPSYSKAWSRLGHARYSKGDNRGAMEAYKAGIDAEGNGGTPLMKVGYETAKKRVDAEEAVTSRGGPSSGGPGAGGPGGFDMASMLNNPMLANLAKEKLGNPAEMQNMLKGLLGGQGMPDMSEIAGLMQNPQFAAMAQNILGSLGGAGGAGGFPGGPGGPGGFGGAGPNN